jgi:hypothetical protein
MPDHPRVGIGLALGDDLSPRMDIEHEGEWVVGDAHHGHHSFVPATLTGVADTSGRRTR